MTSPATIASPSGVGLSYAYDGSLLTGTTWTGPVAGSVTRTYDPDFQVATERVNAGRSFLHFLVLSAPK